MKENLKLENQLCFAVYALSREITKLYRPLLDTLGLTYTQYLVMIVLWEGDGIALKEMGKKLKLDSGTLTPLLKKLENEGLIKRMRDQKDERNLLVYLTDNGKKLIKKAESIPNLMACKIPMPMDELITMRDRIKEVLKDIEKNESEEIKDN